jgi:hypothetical protein
MDGKGYEFAFAKIRISLSLFDLFHDDGHSLILTFSEILKYSVATIATIAGYLDININNNEIQSVHMETEELAIERRNEQRRRTAYSQADLNKVARQLNERPRKTLEFETPAERFNACVALTD